MENPKIVAAYLHILEAAGIFSESNEEVSKTLFSLANWTKEQYGISDGQIEAFSNLVEEIKEEAKTNQEKDA
jgi:hypothetical protein